MKILYAKALVKDLEAVSRNPGVKKRLLTLIEKLKTIGALDELHNHDTACAACEDGVKLTLTLWYLSRE